MCITPYMMYDIELIYMLVDRFVLYSFSLLCVSEYLKDILRELLILNIDLVLLCKDQSSQFTVIYIHSEITVSAHLYQLNHYV